MYELRCFCVSGSSVEDSVVSIGDAGLDTINSMMCHGGELIRFDNICAIKDGVSIRSVTTEYVGRNKVAIIVVKATVIDGIEFDSDIFHLMRQKALNAAMLKANWQ